MTEPQKDLLLELRNEYRRQPPASAAIAKAINAALIEMKMLRKESDVIERWWLASEATLDAVRDWAEDGPPGNWEELRDILDEGRKWNG